MLRRGPGLQDTALFRLPQNLLMTFLLSEWDIAPPATWPRRLAISRAETHMSAVMRAEKGQPTTMRVDRSTTEARHGRPSPVLR